MPQLDERDIFLAVEREVLGRASNHRTCYYDYAFCIPKIQKNILNLDKITLTQDEIVDNLEEIIKRFVSEHSDVFELIGLFYLMVGDEIIFRIKVSPPKPRT